MVKSLFLFSLFNLLFATTPLTAQNDDESKNCKYFLPYTGTWSGNLNIELPSGKQTIPCELKIVYDSLQKSYEWHTIYYTGSSEIEKKYFLKCHEPENGHFLIDENNDIILDAYLKENKLISFYEVLGMYYHTEYEFEKDKIVFQISYFPANSYTTTGGTSSEIPSVNSFSLSGLQRAVFQRN